MIRRLFQTLTGIRAEDGRTVFYSFAYFFFLLCGYYILRPLRDEMGIKGGVDHLHWMFTGTFAAILCLVPFYSLLVSRLPRRRFLPLVYRFFSANILIFWLVFRSGAATEWAARAFFIWVSVFNMFVVSVFWSFMADLFRRDQAKKFFGLIAAGGTCGALAGPLVTLLTLRWTGTINLLLISIFFLELCVFFIRKLHSVRTDEAAGHAGKPDAAMGGGVLSGIRLILSSSFLLMICFYIFLLTGGATFLYMAQAEIVEKTFQDPAKRTALFASIDLGVNILTLLLQTFATARVFSRFGVGAALSILPLVMTAGFLGLYGAPLLGLAVGVQILRRSLSYSMVHPAREVLFTVLGREEKYKSKNFIDTVVYRGGDALNAWIFAGLKGLGLSLPLLMLAALPVCILWMFTGVYLGKRHQAMHEKGESP